MPEPRNKSVFWGIIAVIAVAFLVFWFFTYNSAPDKTRSVEVGIARASLRPNSLGLVIPASCPSFEHYPGECSPPPTISVLVNDKPGPYVFSRPASYTISWNSTGAANCTAGGSWSGTKPPSGSENFSNVPVGVYQYNLTCTGPGGSNSSSVTINVSLIREVAP